MNSFELLKLTDIELFTELIMNLCETFETKERIKEILLTETTEEELRKLNSIAQEKGYPLSLSFKQ